MDPAARVLALLGYLRTRRAPVSFADVREAMPDAYTGTGDAARRKFERDKRSLAEMGADVAWDAAKGGYHLVAAPPRAVAGLSEGHLVTLKEAAAIAYGDPASPLAADALGAIERLSALVRADPYEDARGALVVHHPEREGGAVRERVSRLVVGCWRRLPVRFRYTPEIEPRPPAPRVVDPWGVFARDGRWYLVGRCHDRDDKRTFRVARMEDVEVDGLPDGAPRFDVPRGFDLRAESSTRPWDWAVHRPQLAALDVCVEVAPLVVRALGGTVDVEAAGTRTILRRRVTNRVALLSLATEWLPRVRVAGPPDVAREWAARTAGLASASSEAP